jgi:outer membrane protein assembly factor BamC
MTMKTTMSAIPAPTRTALAMAASAVVLLGGCAATENFLGGDRLDYRSQAGKTAPLEVPPDLTQLARDGRYRPQSGVVSASDAAAPAVGTAAVSAGAPRVALQTAGAIRVERQGSQRWLVVPTSPELLWPQLQAFWQERGFTLAVQNLEAGVMETGWAENRAKLPQDIIRRTLGQVLDSAFSTSERDRFRTRVERGANGTEIYISHRGMQEVVTDRMSGSTVWQPRASDAQLEAEMLSRLLVKLGGVKEDVARTTVASAAEPPAQARPVAASGAVGATSLEVDDGFERAWRRVGLALDRSGFTVEDRDRAAGLYFVRYVAPGSVEEPGFFSRILGTGSVQGPARYRVVVKPAGAKTQISVQNTQGAPETGEAAQKIVAMLVSELR